MRPRSVPSRLAGRKILVTGGAGFIGSAVVDRLIAAGCAEIVIVDDMVRGSRRNLAGALRSDTVRLVEGDIRDRALMARLVPGTDTVFHLAALRITHCAAEPRAALEVMVDATFDLAELCVVESVRKLVYSSSASVYGMADRFPTVEACSPYPNRTLYGAAKAFGEGLLRAFNDQYGLDYVGLRYFNAYGPRMDTHGKYTEVLIRWMERIDAGLPPVIFGDGLQTMDFVHVDDIARANILAAESDATDTVLNVATGVETSLAQLAELLAAAMGRPDLRPEHAAERAVNPVRRRLADVSAAKAMTGFEATVPLADGLKGLVPWWRSVREAEPAGTPFARATA